MESQQLETTETVRLRPELLAPAGEWACAQAAVENGADAIYFGLDCGFNARHRAQNFHLDDLDELMPFLHRRGVRGYTTMNTLVFPSELPRLVPLIERIAESGVDAVLVQDFGVARLVREICPQLEIHASTQMSLTSAETIAVAERLGLSRVVLARELSTKEIAKIAAHTTMPLEVFIHGALCVAYSGQCLTSESLGGRSANRGQCAQACRLPYEVVCDGEDVDLGDVRYLLSPQDLAGYDSIVALIDAGIASLKIEGRLKTPEYVANITGHYRRAIDQAFEQGTVSIDQRAQQEMELSFSRGFSPGWLEGNDHKRLVPGKQSAKRGIRLGRVEQVRNEQVLTTLEADLALGDGLGIESINREGSEQAMEGGRVYSISTRSGEGVKKALSGDAVWIGFGRGEIDWESIEDDATVFKNDDPQLNKRLRKTFDTGKPNRRLDVDFAVQAIVGQPLTITASVAATSDQTADVTVKQVTVKQVTVKSEQLLEVARKHPADEAMLRDKLERLGTTQFSLRDLNVTIEGGPMVPASLLNELRRQVTEKLDVALASSSPRQIRRDAAQAMLAPIVAEEAAEESASNASPKLALLCRTLEQVQTAAESGADLIYADFHDIREYAKVADIVRPSGVPFGIATVRMQKPGETGLLRVLERHGADLILARNLAALGYFHGKGMPVVADFSLNVANHRSAEWIRSLGAERATVSYDLNRDQLGDLVNSLPSHWLEVVIHQHIPMFHMEHCVFCSVLSPGTNKTNCGRPCDEHVVQLRDRVGALHPLNADVACRNTLYNATPQSGAETTGELLNAGVNWFRVELLEENAGETKRTLDLYRQLLRGEIDGASVWQTLKATNRLGVTRGTLESKRNPLAVL
ncbi:U32 family peptidase [Rhodopirellula sp. MGV]|uniref:U32 family peptidase n=1 Tax=Rhodopirellula sp. MGV TaxID=2023130 RepID=UPI000B973B0C|nr:U32 family peptidase [Rhodopirellula sp. MGV]OYP29969.1 peptidase U32 [Rhodopirellula sp. MGV]PNY33425.1 U32 family peptidase [Rhodopirellula baltica]